MKPYYADDWLTLYGGDCREVLAELPADSVDCIVTSPPYWGLRDYGTDGQLGLERTPEEYVANMVAVFRELRRVLKPGGTCWLNLGDSYNAYNGGAGPSSSISAGASTTERPRLETGFGLRTKGLKPKDLVGIPWRVAFALQADGWFLRSDIIWSKPNPMPESVTDRPTKSHEYLFLLTKSARYYFDADAVREDAISAGEIRGGGHKASTNGIHGNREDGQRLAALGSKPTAAGRNIRSVWSIATRPYPGAHFAVFPPELPERCIKAGSSEKGVCPECGTPWERVVERTGAVNDRDRRPAGEPEGMGASGIRSLSGATYQRTTAGTSHWRPSCAHTADPIPATTLDCFGGSGTVGMVANRLSRRAILIDLNPEYLKQQLQRNAQTPLGLGAA